MGRSTIAKWCTAVTMLSVIVSALLAIVNAPWWAAAVAALTGMAAFILSSGLRRHFQTVTRPLGIQRDYRAAWLVVGAFIAVRDSPDMRVLVAVVLLL